MKAIISDIHANLEALTRVCEDIEGLGITDILCLGDIVGYGADPEACTDIIMNMAKVALLGNHDFALMYGPIGFNPIAADVIRITRGIMNPAEKGRRDEHFLSCADTMQGVKCLAIRHSKVDRWKFIEGLQQKHIEENSLYIHASPAEPVFEYVFPDRFPSGWNSMRLKELFEMVDGVAFCGHTHMPCVINSDLTCVYPEQTNYRFTLEEGKKYIINTGSVGQPRDGDNRSCYLVYDEQEHTVEWRRLTYDIDATAGKIEAMCGKGSWCASRLFRGR